MLDIEFITILYKILLSQVLKIVMENLSKLILSNTKSFILENLSNYNILNRVLEVKKNNKIYISNYNLKGNKSIMPNFYIKLYKYLDKKKLITDIKIKNKIIKGFIDDIKIKINDNLYIEITNRIFNDTDLESKIEIYSMTNDLDIEKLIKKIEEYNLDN